MLRGFKSLSFMVTMCSKSGCLRRAGEEEYGRNPSYRFGHLYGSIDCHKREGTIELETNESFYTLRCVVLHVTNVKQTRRALLHIYYTNRAVEIQFAYPNC
jgi:hypothetical protein